MGNRAHVIWTDGREMSPAVYLHWNGGPESVYAFLAELERRECRRDLSYAPARFCELVGEFFGGSLSLGIVNGPRDESLKALAPFDHGDNGVYVVDVRKDEVRHYVPSRDGWMRLLTAEQAKRERELAEGHKYAEEFRAFFAGPRRHDAYYADEVTV